MTSSQSVVKLVLDDNNRVDVNLHGKYFPEFHMIGIRRCVVRAFVRVFVWCPFLSVSERSTYCRSNVNIMDT